jgi:hypothetical protein
MLATENATYSRDKTVDVRPHFGMNNIVVHLLRIHIEGIQ